MVVCVSVCASAQRDVRQMSGASAQPGEVLVPKCHLGTSSWCMYRLEDGQLLSLLVCVQAGIKVHTCAKLAYQTQQNVAYGAVLVI